MRLQDQSNKRCTKEIKYKDICNNYQGGRNLKQIVGQTTSDRTNCRIKFMVYGTMSLYYKEEWITAISTRLSEIEPVYDKGQDAITLD